jgi:hypothetical protein
MKPLYQIISNDPGKSCDFFPYGSLHLEKEKIHYFCEVAEIPADTRAKYCLGGCNNHFPLDWPFVQGSDMCVRCFGKGHVNFTTRERYYQAVRQEVLMGLKIKTE